jgi:hypothetical protein
LELRTGERKERVDDDLFTCCFFGGRAGGSLACIVSIGSHSKSDFDLCFTDGTVGEAAIEVEEPTSSSWLLPNTDFVDAKPFELKQRKIIISHRHTQVFCIVAICRCNGRR